MTLKEAIKELEKLQKFPHAVYWGRLEPATKLLIEAGKRIAFCRGSDCPLAFDKLPGETEE